MAMTNRAGLLALMLHQTIQHDPVTTDLRTHTERWEDSLSYLYKGREGFVLKIDISLNFYKKKKKLCWAGV